MSGSLRRIADAHRPGSRVDLLHPEPVVRFEPLPSEAFPRLWVQTYPSQPVRWIVGLPPVDGVDIAVVRGEMTRRFE